MSYRIVAYVTLGLIGLGLLSRAALMKARPMDAYVAMQQKEGDEQYYVQIAQALVADGEFREGHLRAYRPPAYPSFIACHLLLFGDNLRAVQVTQNLLFLLAVVVVGWMAARALGKPAALVGAFLLLINPAWLMLPQTAYSEPLLVVLLGVGIFLNLKIDGNSAWHLALASGAIFGLAALVKEIGLVIGFGVAVVTWWSLRQAGDPGRGRVALVAVAGMLLAVAPWTARNYVTFGRFVPITTNSTINLYMGNNPEATGGMHWKLPHAAQKLWQQPSAGNANEIEVARLCGREAVMYMLDHPRETVALWPAKLWVLWGPGRQLESASRIDALFRLYRTIFWPIYLLLSVIGLWLLRRERLGRIIILSALLGTLVHLVTYGMPLYRAPYEILFAIPAAWTLVRVGRRLAQARNRKATALQPALAEA